MTAWWWEYISPKNEGKEKMRRYADPIDQLLQLADPDVFFDDTADEIDTADVDVRPEEQETGRVASAIAHASKHVCWEDVDAMKFVAAIAADPVAFSLVRAELGV